MTPERLTTGPVLAQDEAESKVRALLWNEYPICCGNFQGGEWHMGMREPGQCCGSPDRDMLRDADIVKALRELFPEKTASPSSAVAQHSDDAAVDCFARAMKEKLALAREKGRSGWEQCDAADLSYMLREHVEKGDPRDVANFCMFLWSLGKPIGDARPVVDLQLTMLDGIQVWIDAYTNAANGPHFMGHGRIVQLLREYLALRKLLAQRNPPPLPETHFNGRGDGSEPLYTADMMRLYAMQHAASITLPAGPAQRFQTQPVRTPSSALVLKYCELTNRHPMGMQAVSSSEGWIESTFYQVAERELQAMFAAQAALPEPESGE